LWTPAHFSASVGGAPIEVLKQYIQNQEKPS
ncbi:MAG: transposase, partial [Leptolyngbyaceae cyanobacterium]